MLTLLVLSVEDEREEEIYKRINVFIEDVLGAEQNPVDQKNLFYKWPSFETLRQAQMVWKQGNVLKHLSGHVFLISLFNAMNRFNLKLPGLDVPEYKKDMIVNSDYRKFDDTLRMVIDCTDEQAQEIEVYLEAMQDEGLIVYGTHYSGSALMTCFVQTLQKTDHIHFIDGNDGGYALAAQQMKARLAVYRELAAA